MDEGEKLFYGGILVFLIVVIASIYLSQVGSASSQAIISSSQRFVAGDSVQLSSDRYVAPEEQTLIIGAGTGASQAIISSSQRFVAGDSVQLSSDRYVAPEEQTLIIGAGTDYLAAPDFNTYGDQRYTPLSRKLGINGTVYDLSADRNWAITTSGTDTNWQTSWSIFDANMRATYNLPAMPLDGYLDTNTVTAGWTDFAGKWLPDFNTAKSVRIDENLYVTRNIELSNGANRIIKMPDVTSPNSSYDFTISAGNALFRAGEMHGGYGGDLNLNAGDGSQGSGEDQTSGNGGNVTINAGEGGISGQPGNINLNPGLSNNAFTAGKVYVNSGMNIDGNLAITAGATRNIYVKTPSAPGTLGNDLSIFSGTGGSSIGEGNPGGNGGALTLFGGNGGNCGDSTVGNGGNVVLQGGAAGTSIYDTGLGGDVFIRGGIEANGGIGGNAYIDGGTGTPAGNIYLGNTNGQIYTNHIHMADNIASYYGTGNNASIKYDGNNLNIKANNVGTGHINFNSFAFVNGLSLYPAITDFSVGKDNAIAYGGWSVASNTVTHIPTLFFARSRGTHAAPTAITLATQGLGILGFYGQGGTNVGEVYEAASIRGYPDGAFTTTSSPGNLRFYTTPSATVTGVERMRIDSNGYVGINTNAPRNKLNVVGDINASGATSFINVDTNYRVSGTAGITKNMTILKDVNLVELTKTYCDMNFKGGILVATSCS